MKRQPVTQRDIELNLPILLDGDLYSYTVERFSPLIWRVWLNHHYPFDYACGKPVRTIWGFVKQDGSVMKPTNSKKVSRDKVCKLDELTDDMWRTTITPLYTNLLSYYD